MRYSKFAATFIQLFLVSILVRGLPASPTQLDRDCYDTGGKQRSYLKACDSQASISHCCNHADLCLDNGLCLNFGWDRLYQLHGCTDPDWATPCLNQLRNDYEADSRTTVWMCEIQDNKHTHFCAGSKECCKDSNNYVSLHNYNAIYSPKRPQLRIDNFDGLEPPDMEPPLSPPSETAENTGLSSSDRIALGVGIPACFAVFIALYQCLFPGARLFPRKKTDSEHHSRHQATPNTEGNNTSIPRTGLDQRPEEPYFDDPLPESYSDSIGSLVESEDGWRNSH